MMELLIVVVKNASIEHKHLRFMTGFLERVCDVT